MQVLTVVLLACCLPAQQLTDSIGAMKKAKISLTVVLEIATANAPGERTVIAVPYMRQGQAIYQVITFGAEKQRQIIINAVNGQVIENRVLEDSIAPIPEHVK